MRRKDHEKWRASVESWRAEHQVGRCVDDDVARHIADLERRAARYSPEMLSRLTDADRDHVHCLLEEFSAEREARRRAHEQRLISTARRLGREVRAHLVTMPDAERRLDALALTLDQDSPPIPIVPYRQAVAILRDAFIEGCRGGDS
jgi:hypothetical protein